MKQYILLLFSAGLVIGLNACSNKSNQEKQGALLDIPIVIVKQKDTTLNTDYVSDIQAIKNVEIRARVQGFLDRILIDEGHEVKKGQLMFQINDLELKTELARAKANVSNAIAEAKAAELEAARTKTMVEKKIISNTEYELAFSKLKAANAKIDEANSFQLSAETKLSYTNIRAPFDGVIDRIPLKIGSLIDPGALLTTLSDISKVYTYFHISENEYLQLKKSLYQEPLKNKVLHLILVDGSTYPFPGKIETTDGKFNDNTGAIGFRAIFTNPNKLLKHGATGKVRLTSFVNDAILIPQKSAFEIQDKNYVFTVDDKNQITMRPFTSNNRVAQYYIVDIGLKPGERIVYEGIQNLRQGDFISPKIMNIDSLMQLSIKQN